MLRRYLVTFELVGADVLDASAYGRSLAERECRAGTGFARSLTFRGVTETASTAMVPAGRDTGADQALDASTVDGEADWWPPLLS
jgi:hypothetical protein